MARHSRNQTMNDLYEAIFVSVINERYYSLDFKIKDIIRGREEGEVISSWLITLALCRLEPNQRIVFSTLNRISLHSF